VKGKKEEEEKRNASKSQERELEKMIKDVVTNPGTSMVIIPLEECNPMETIPVIFHSHL
jgi:hypothetical protein